jgi:hypothetical protein
LKKIDVNVVRNTELCEYELAPFWIPAGDLSAFSQMEIDLLSKSNVTLGPNIDWFNLANLNVVSQLGTVKILVPHHWVVLPVKRSLPENSRVVVWPCGIDIDFWRKEKNHLQVEEVLIYLKNLTDVENLKAARDFLRKRNILFTVLEYGSYSQEEFKSVLNRVSAAIWIGDTESQGLALLESWSMNVPTLVLKKETWYNSDGEPFPASSAPYLSKTVGQFSNSSTFSEEDFDSFLVQFKSFSPRVTVEETFNLTSSASNLIKILEL